MEKKEENSPKKYNPDCSQNNKRSSNDPLEASWELEI
jgi:hypothetical protein